MNDDLEQQIKKHEDELKRYSLTCHQQEAIKRHIELLKKQQKWAGALEKFEKITKSPFEKKLKQTKQIIKNAIDKFGDACVIACSWGKDSIVMIHLAIQIKTDIRIIFSNTGVEFPETYKYRDKITKEWDLNYIELKPEKTFWQCVDKYGYPPIRYLGRQKKKAVESGMVKKSASKFLRDDKIPCCYFLKEKPAIDYYKEKNIKCALVGITYDESYTRRWVIIRWGVIFPPKKYFYTRIYPIGYWNSDDVWGYIKQNNVPVNFAYQKYDVDRVGCIPCTGHLHWEEQMARINFRLYQKIATDLGKPPLENWL